MKPVKLLMAVFAIAVPVLLLSGCGIDWQQIPDTPRSSYRCCGGSGG